MINNDHSMLNVPMCHQGAILDLDGATTREWWNTIQSSHCTVFRFEIAINTNAIMSAWRASVTCLLLLKGAAEGFSPLQHRSASSLTRKDFSPRPRTALWAAESELKEGEWQLPNDFKMFLTQCSIQSFIFLVRSMRDPQTVMWVEEFTQPAISRKKLPLNVTILVDSREEAKEDLVAEANATSTAENSTATTENATSTTEAPKSSKLLQYHGLAALNTTIFPTWDAYFQELLQQPSESFVVESNQAHIPDYELDIDPASLCSRIISVREQISKEFVRDLQVIADMGGHALESYWDSLRQMREIGDKETETGTVQRENLLFLEFNADSDSDLAPSPLRKGNFDLLVLLATQESIHRVLNDKSRQHRPERVTNEFLRTFYMERMHYFRGPQRYGRADDFLEELLATPPSMITVDEGVTSLIDPTRIAELVMEAREDVATEWKALAAESPKEHMEIQRMRLNRIMGVQDVDMRFLPITRALDSKVAYGYCFVQ